MRQRIRTGDNRYEKGTPGRRCLPTRHILPVQHHHLVAIGCFAVFSLSLLSTTSADAAVGPPIIGPTSFSTVTETSARLDAAVDPNGAKITDAHFDYIPLAAYEDADNTFGEETIHTAPIKLPVQVEGTGQLSAAIGTGDLTQDSDVITNLSASEGSFEVGQTISGKGIPTGSVINAVDGDSLTLSSQATETIALDQLQAGSTLITNIATTNEGAFATGQAIFAAGIPIGTTITAVQAGQLQISKPANKPGAPTLTATGLQPLSTELEGLAPHTAYRLRFSARNSKATVFGPTEALYTSAPPPIFGPCPNDLFRTGEYAPFGHPSAQLPDCRAYEQASPVGKNGGDILGQQDFVRAAPLDGGITFGSTFGVPGGSGAQSLPYYDASRGKGTAGWSTRGLLPPAQTGAKANVKGWLPDLSESFAESVKLGSPRTKALFELHADGDTPTQITPYVPHSGAEQLYNYAGASAEGRTLVFEAPVKLPTTEGESPIPLARDGSQNVYVWDSTSRRTSLASVMNTVADTETALPGGAFVGPYDWARGNTSAGGSGSNYYTQDNHAVTEDGSVYFTAAGSGQLYERINPIAPQSAPGPDGFFENGRCAEPAKSCTVQVSASERTPFDPAGSAPAAFQLSLFNGASTLFTSSEELTNDANTGPVQPPARVGRATVSGDTKAGEVEQNFLSAHALGVAVSPDGEFIYWVDPITNKIARAELHEGHPTNPDLDYIDPGMTTYVNTDEHGKPKTLTAPATPRYVAVDDNYVYWTNTGPLGFGGFSDKDTAIIGAGTIGRARIGTSKGEEVKPEFITGASNPLGIAVNTDHIFWANSAGFDPDDPASSHDPNKRSIARASIDGQEVAQNFLPTTSLVPIGVTVSSTNVYFTGNEGEGLAYILRIPLDNPDSGEHGNEKFIFVGQSSLRGIAVDSNYVYWTDGTGSSIGRSAFDGFEKFGGCAANANCDRQFASGISGELGGLALDNNHLFWSINGKTPPNPGNDLYLYQGDGATLTDLTPDSVDPNGAEVQGVIGSSEDGSVTYFVANADLDGGGEAKPGDCRASKNNITHATGSCNLYRLHAGVDAFLARIEPGFPLGGNQGGEVSAWAPTPFSLSSTSGYNPKTAVVSANGTLLLLSRQRLTDYDNGGIAEFYRFQGETVTCITCNPTGETGTTSLTFGAPGYPGPLSPGLTTDVTSVRYLSADGSRVFFETPEALVSADVNQVKDVYEWELPGIGTCLTTASSYSPLNQGCIYLISTGQGAEPAFFADASADGSDVFFFTRSRLVGQDTDQLTDIYDARVEGGLAAQNPVFAPPCEAEGCKGAIPESLPLPNPPDFSGPGNPKKNRPKPCAKKKSKKHRCHDHQKKHHRPPSKSEHRSGGRK